MTTVKRKAAGGTGKSGRGGSTGKGAGRGKSSPGSDSSGKGAGRSGPSPSKKAPGTSGSGPSKKPGGKPGGKPGAKEKAGAKAGAAPAPRWSRLIPSRGSLRFLEHVKVLFAFLVWVTLIRQQSALIVNWQLYYAQALVATAALAVGSVMVVYMYPPRTARWRTVAWAFLFSSLTGALLYAALGGRAGLLGALAGGALVLWARGAERGRRAFRRMRQARRT
ncbi:hypothetical protein ACFV6E_38890 [Streptomyces sp. NPDC059785]|uniref:hypothetical protein n=1 Tax=unclassified Streptomyces TaxID=2593676 RepID=UPI0036527A00